MTRAPLRALTFAVLLAAQAVALTAQTGAAPAAIAYHLSFPQREHRLMDVTVTFTGVPDGPLRLHMSRSSPGRYALHQFAKNLFDLKATDGAGAPLGVIRTAPEEWVVPTHGRTVSVSYRVFGDRVDGTYLSVDSTHAHINMPPVILWAVGLDRLPIEVRFEPPAGSNWRVATQLFPGPDEFTFTAPNLQYLMDSPSEFGSFDLRTFSVPDGSRTPTFRLAVHHSGDGGELDGFARDVEKIVREARNIYGEFAPYDAGTYTFLADYLPQGNMDGMEHRNSTVVTAGVSIRGSRLDLLDTIAHEFFHSWNVERIRPRSLEPFNLDDVNMSGELWLAEGFTSYFGALVMRRTGLTTTREFAQELGHVVNAVITAPGRKVRTAEEMSQQAPFTDAATAIDRTNFENTFISYYTWGEAIGLALDLSLRDRTSGKATLDRFMRTMWERFGKPGGEPGYVSKPYTIDDAKAVLASVAGSPEFAQQFFAKYIQGHDTADYTALLGRAGLVMRPLNPGAAYAGGLQLHTAGDGVRVVTEVPFDSPAFAAGLDREDRVLSIGGTAVTTESTVREAIARRKPGDEVSIVFERRGGERVTAMLKLVADPRVEIVTIEETGKMPTGAQRTFRRNWFGSER
ncbi:MAG TPA: PDZ domain-containing protein [Vicinamibacterales bacterium]|nr:PDZ domain-containing protein [Vicinamibacterales bacterium]